MKKTTALVFVLLFVLTLTVLVGCGDTDRYSIEMKNEDWLYEKIPASAKAGETVTVKIKLATDLGYIFTVNGEQIEQDDVESSDYWQFSFTMPSEDVTIDFRTYDGFLPDRAYGTLMEAYLLQHPDAEYASVRKYYGEYNNGALAAIIDAGDNTANEWSEEVAGCSFAYGDGNRVTVLYGGEFHTLPEAFEKGYLTEGDIKEIFSRHSDGRSESAENELEFAVQYIRTDGYHEGARYPAVTVIRSVDELNAYYEANKDIYSLERRTGTIYSDSTIGFLDACDKYGEEYFEDHILLTVLLEEGSGSVRHTVERVAENENGIEVDITTIVPELCTDDMAEWHILIELEAGDFTEDYITVFINGRNATEKLTEVYYAKGYANIALTLKEGWEYDITDEPDTEDFSVNIYPERYKDNELRVSYFETFGVCGTELTSEEIRLGRYDALVGTHVSNELWSFITLRDTFGDYVIVNGGAEKWWSEYGGEAMEILATLKVGEGCVSEKDAVQIAKDKADSADEAPEVGFDKEAGLWYITLSGKNTLGDDTFVIDVRGNIVDIIENDAPPASEAVPDIENSVFGFDSFEELIAAFDENEHSPTAASLRELKNVLGDTYTEFVDRIKEDKAFPLPLHEGEPIAFRDKKGFSNISFLVNELYGLPWIWYFPKVTTEENYYISTTYLPVGMTDDQKKMTASEVIKILSPNSANVNNLGEHHKSIEERQIKLSDREVTAMEIEYKDDKRSSIYFVYGDLLVIVRCDTAVWTDEWFSALSFDAVKI